MVDVRPNSPSLHNDPVLFRESVTFTAAQTGFSSSLIEKDYFCSVLLDFLKENASDQLLFKGGTCLAKVYTDFYRLSEDLDFMIPVSVDARRKERSERAAAFKKAVSDLPKTYQFFQIEEPLKGRNQSRQYIATVAYKSLIGGQLDRIRLEIGLREPLLTKIVHGKVKTLLQNAGNPQDTIAPIPFNCLSYEEAMAEKFRAALTRKEAAIRDFYDIDYAALKKDLNTNAPEFINMVQKKLAIPGNDPPDLSDDRVSMLSDQLNSRLKPVLREKDFKAFDFERAIRIVKAVHKQLEGVS